LIAQKKGESLHWDVRLGGPQETVFLDL
jgi:hypothetical protein